MKILCVILLCMSAPAFAGVSGSIGGVSNYVWRGVSQTDGSAAIQASLGAEAGGFYGSVWGSQVDFGDAINAEVDIQIGFSAGDKIGIDVGAISYNYLDHYSADKRQNFLLQEDMREIYIGVFAGPVSATVYQETEEKERYYSLGVDVGQYLPIDLNLFAGEYEDSDTDYGVSVGKSWQNGIQLSYTYTYLEDSEHSFGVFYNF